MTAQLLQGQALHPSAAFEISSTTKGFLPPRMTTAQINAIQSPAPGLIVYNTSSHTLEIYDSNNWVELVLSTASPTIPNLFDADKDTSISVEENANEDIIRFKTAGTERMRISAAGNVGIGNLTPNDALVVSGTAHISGKLKDSSGDTGTDGQVLTATVTGTNWADGDGGGIQLVSSLPTDASEGDTYLDTTGNSINIFREGDGWYTFKSSVADFKGMTIVHNNLTYKTILSSGTGAIWLDRNIGATAVPTGTGSTGTQFGDFYTWDDARAANRCPPGFHLPTKAEWSAEAAYIKNAAEAFAVLKLTLMGYRTTGTGPDATSSINDGAWYWASTAAASNAGDAFNFGANNASLSSDGKWYGNPVRCIAD